MEKGRGETRLLFETTLSPNDTYICSAPHLCADDVNVSVSCCLTAMDSYLS